MLLFLKSYQKCGSEVHFKVFENLKKLKNCIFLCESPTKNHFFKLICFKNVVAKSIKKLPCIFIKQGYALKKCVEGVSDEVFYPWESPKKIRLNSVNPTFATEQKKVLIHR